MGVLGSIFGFGDQIKRNIRDFASNPKDYVEGAVHQNNIEWKKDPVERSIGFFNPVPLGTMGKFILNKKVEDAIESLSRRDFMKKSAGIAGGTAAASIPGAKLLQKFAPEERTVAKELAVESAPKYKYNSLEEYLDDVSNTSREATDNFVSDWQYANYSQGHPDQGVPWTNSREFDKGIDDFYNSSFRQRLLEDEALYKEAKSRDPSSFRLDVEHHPINGPTVYPRDRILHKELTSFSPQAKQEMKDLKELTHKLHTDYGGNPAVSPWVDWLTNNPEKVQESLDFLRKHVKLTN